MKICETLSIHFSHRKQIMALRGAMVCFIILMLLCESSNSFPTFESLIKNLWHSKQPDPIDLIETHKTESERIKRQASTAADSSSLHYEVLTTG